jgi:transcriptional regulator with XRE-family HTH domain
MDEDAFNETWYDDEVATFGDRLSAAREKAGLSQSELARQVGVDIETLRAWEDDRTEPRANRLQMLAGLVSVSLAWLLTGKGDGVTAPHEHRDGTGDLAVVLGDLRRVKAGIAQSTEALARIEKRVEFLMSAADA